MQQLNLLEAPRPDLNPDQLGFRLQRFEVYNWGTFHHKIWGLDLDGKNALLTGDIGTGKSTLVDGFMTLLYPRQKLAYNLAAGAGKRERSLESYVRGAYSRDESGAVNLRDQSEYSVLLAVFQNEALNETVSLAQVIWQSASGKFERLWIIGECLLSTLGDLSDFGPHISALKQRLKARPDVVLFSNFTDYQHHFCKLLGIRKARALDLFYQTVFLKTVGDITQFVRHNMLESPGEALERLLQDIIQGFDALNACYAQMVRAREQMNLLYPVIQELSDYKAHQAEQKRLSHLQQHIPAYFDRQLADSLELALADNRYQIKQREAHYQSDKRRQQELQETLFQLRSALENDQTGQQILALQREIEAGAIQLQRIQSERRQYTRQAESLQISTPETRAAFDYNQARLESLAGEWQAKAEALDGQRLQQEIQLSSQRQNQADLQSELVSLQQRSNLLPQSYEQLRQSLAAELGLELAQIPFAAELIQVREDQSEWEPALERFLRGLGLTLLVPERQISTVLDWINTQNLGLRLVLYPVPAQFVFSLPELDAQHLIKKLEFHPEAPQVGWLQNHLLQRYDFICCQPQLMERYTQALTPRGLVKRPGKRHEKDDRFALGDRQDYLLGWTNHKKIEALLAELEHLDQALSIAQAALKQTLNAQELARKARQQIEILGQWEQFEALDLASCQQAQAERLQRLQALEASSDNLQQLQAQLKAQQAAILQSQTAIDQSLIQLTRLETERERLQAELSHCEPMPLNDPFQPEMAACVQGLGLKTDSASTPSQWQAFKHKALAKLGQALDQSQRDVQRSERELGRGMRNYLQGFPEARQSLTGDDPREAEDFAAIYERLSADDLPRFESQFKEKLNTESRYGLSMLNSFLNQQRSAVKQQIHELNESLRTIDYHLGTYIELHAARENHIHLTQFEEQLKKVISDPALTNPEASFQLMKQIIDQLAGRSPEAQESEAYRRQWLEVVTDVRYQFSFSAKEIERESGKLREHYADASGKSGGQKEKLAYTILASALALQFGLHDPQPRSFRLLLIDEAFGKGSSESTRYALRLFKSYQLQSLIVTPLQKIEVIEPFVASFHLVSNPSQQNSEITALTALDFEMLKQQHGET